MRFGILYNLVDSVQKGEDIEKLADNEIIDTVAAVKKALERAGHSAEFIRVNISEFHTFRKRFDFIFNLAEGIDGDITAEPMIAAELKKAGMGFTGSDEDALTSCLDKLKTKEMLLKNHIPTPEFQLFKSVKEKRKPSLTFPLIVKPVHEDASIGINSSSVVHDDSQLMAKVSEILGLYKQPALVEEFIDGREINAALLGNGDKVQVLPLSEIIFDFPEGVPRIVSFEAKWIEDSMQYKKTTGKCPAELPENMKEKIISSAKRAFAIMGCKDYARVDFRIKGEDVFIIEVNPNPCINPEGAGFIRSAKAAGYSYDDLINRIAELAVARRSA
ncbi:MAG: ATP-grasp domain-containing protein [archaeon]